jgi:23S rRNA pseudouridine2457 synthase
MVSQFVSPDKVNLLGDLNFNFPKGTSAVGRLDNHSEGLLILTTNKKLQKLLFLSKEPHTRKYLILIRGFISAENLQQLREGVDIKIKGGEFYKTKPCDVEVVCMPENLPESTFVFDSKIPHTWLTITLTEGKYHQVRKMVGVLHHPVRRLIRLSIEDLEIGDMLPGEVREFEENELFRKLKI